jgi:hypothetical protein
MPWNVLFHESFEAEFAILPEDLQDEMLAHISLIAEFGPTLGRPSVDTLKASQHKNMKELRFQMQGVWRVAFAFDPQRQAILLVAGNKQGKNQKKFYQNLIRTADARFSEYLQAEERKK